MTARVVAIVGPTAVGKTAVALQVADRLNAEIVSVDSMQAYRGMDVGTAKPAAGDRERIRHHLVDIVDLDEELTVADFQNHARAAIDDIVGRDRLPLLVGGSGLYFRAIVDELDFPPRDETIRRELEQEAEDGGAEALHARLEGLDPVAASRIEPGNARRTIRALEAIELTGRPFSENDAWDRYESRYDLTVAGLERRREELYARIAARVDRMLEEGLLEEVLRLDAAGLSRTARQALGYKQVLDAGAADRDTIRAEIIRATKRFARRQESWFRADPRVAWFDADRSDVVERVVDFLGTGARDQRDGGNGQR